jgi:arsenate reductase-like glutaredoxin family protein
MAYSTDVIMKDHEVMGGMPAFRGTQVPVKNLADYLEGGRTVDEFRDRAARRGSGGVARAAGRHGAASQFSPYLKQKPMAPAGIKRFIDRFGLHSLLDTEGTAYIDAGPKYLKLTDAELLARIERDPRLLRLPLIRAAKCVSIGDDEDSWKAML